MNIITNAQLRQLELIQEKQKIINELNDLETASSVPIVISTEAHQYTFNPYRNTQDINSWLENIFINPSLSEASMPILFFEASFNNISVSLSTENSDTWIKSFFKDNFYVKAKIKSVEKAQFRIFTP